MEIEDMSDADLHMLVQQIQTLLQQRQQEEVNRHNDMRAEIFQAIGTLTSLLGPEDPPRPTMENLVVGNVSIREVLTFTPEELQAHSGLAIQLVLRGMEVLTATEIALAEVESRR